MQGGVRRRARQGRNKSPDLLLKPLKFRKGSNNHAYSKKAKIFLIRRKPQGLTKMKTRKTTGKKNPAGKLLIFKTALMKATENAALCPVLHYFHTGK